MKNVERVLEVWLERNIYESEFVNKLIKKLQGNLIYDIFKFNKF